MTTMHFCYCYDCDEVGAVVPPNNGVFRDVNDGISMHSEHHIHVFGDPDDYTPPIRYTLVALGSDLPVDDNVFVLFKLAIDLGDLDNVPDARGIKNGGYDKPPVKLPRAWKPKDESVRVEIPEHHCGICANRIFEVGEGARCGINGKRVAFFMTTCDLWQAIGAPCLILQPELFEVDA